MSEYEASAKATEALADTTGKGIDAVRELGGFFSRVFGPALIEAGGMLHDRFRYRRAENLMRLRTRYELKRVQLGLEEECREASLKFGVPLIEAASVEDDDTLMDMFATLLANATSSAGEASSRRTFVTTLQDMEALDATVLLSVYNSPPANPRLYPLRTVYTCGLPDRFSAKDADDGGKIIEPTHEVQIALWNLAKLGCVSPAGLWDGAASIGVVTLTALGIALIEAATLPSQRTSRQPPATAVSPSDERCL